MEKPAINLTRWMAEFEIEAHVVLPPGKDTLSYQDPSGKYSIELTNKSVEAGCKVPVLRAVVIVEAASIESVKEDATVFLKDFLSTLSLVTKAKLEVIRLKRIMDWTLGISERRIRQFEVFPDPNFPVYGLSADHLSTALFLAQATKDKHVHRAVRWFHRGVNAQFFEDQFQCFWFAIESLARRETETERVALVCPQCRQDLHCPKCDETPSRMPLPKQVIEKILRRHGRGPKEVIDTVISSIMKTRNMLLHGNFTEEVERHVPIKMKNQIDNLGNVTWAAILSAHQPPKEEKRLEFMQPNTYAHYEVAMHVDGAISAKSDPNNPLPDDYGGLTVQMTVHDS